MDVQGNEKPTLPGASTEDPNKNEETYAMCKNEKCSSLKQPRASTFVGYNRPKIFFLRVCQKRLMSYFWCIYKHGVGNISDPIKYTH